MSLFKSINHAEVAGKVSLSKGLAQELPSKISEKLSVSDLDKINALRISELAKLADNCSALEKAAGIEGAGGGYGVARWRIDEESNEPAWRTPYDPERVIYVRAKYFAVADKQMRRKLIKAESDYRRYYGAMLQAQVREAIDALNNTSEALKAPTERFLGMVFAGILIWLGGIVNDIVGMIWGSAVGVYVGLSWALTTQENRRADFASCRVYYAKVQQKSHATNSGLHTFNADEISSGEVDDELAKYWDKKRGVKKDDRV